VTPIQRDLQAQVLYALWHVNAGTVDQVRAALPTHHLRAYTTLQTVLNRLAKHGLVSRAKRGNAFVYAPRLSEADYIVRAIENTLESASSEARQAAIGYLIGGLDEAEIAELRRRGRELEEKRPER
jgi:predicted transcriptional regulator